MTEAKQPPSTRQLLELVNTVEHHIEAIKPLLTMALDNPTVDMNDCLNFDKTARYKLTLMTRLLMAATSSEAFSKPSFMIGGEESEK